MNHSEQVAEETTPLVGNGKHERRERNEETTKRYLWIVSTVVVFLTTLYAIYSTRFRSQTVRVEEPEQVANEEESLYSYRTQCHSSKPVKILQTSLSTPSQPWSWQYCEPSSLRTVELNEFLFPDAILSVNFTDRSPHPVLGFGGAFTEASARNFQRLSPSSQKVVLELLFGKQGLGYTIGRIPIHSCDFTVESYTFDHVEDDFDLEFFDTTLQHDHDNGMIDFIQRALAMHNVSFPDEDPFHVFASPWSPPSWMKRPTWEDLPGAQHAHRMEYSAEPSCLRGSLGNDQDSKYAQAWSKYFAKYIRSYHDAGVPIQTVTVQNEPEFAAPWEACSYSPENMTDFVAYHLGPALEELDTKILGFDHNRDHVDHWMMVMLDGKYPASREAKKYLAGTAYHWYAGGMDRLLDGALGVANLHALREHLRQLNRTDDLVLGSEACHCPTTGYAGGNLDIAWSRAERYGHTILADLAAGSNGWVEWNLLLDSIGGPNHLGNLCDTGLLSVPHRAVNATADIKPLPDFENHEPMHHRIIGDEHTREELNAMGLPAKYLDYGIAVQPIFHYMGHISKFVRPGAVSVHGLVDQSLGSSGAIFRKADETVLGGGENDLARDGIEVLLWPCEGSTRQQFKWSLDDRNRVTVNGHDWLGNPTTSCLTRQVDGDLKTMRMTACGKHAGTFELEPLHNETLYRVRLLNPIDRSPEESCLSVGALGNNGGSYGPRGGALMVLGDCSDDAAVWSIDMDMGVASSMFFATSPDDATARVCATTGWPFLQMGAFANGKNRTVVVMNEAKDTANYALRDESSVILTGSIPPRSIQTILLD